MILADWILIGGVLFAVFVYAIAFVAGSGEDSGPERSANYS